MGQSRLLVVLALLAACGGAEPPPAESSVARVVPSSSAAVVPPAPPPPPPFDFALPAEACMSASIDATKLAGVERSLAELQPELERALGAPHVDGFHAFLVSRGIDDARPVTLAVLAPGEEAKKVIAALQPLVPAQSPEAGTGIIGALRNQGSASSPPLLDTLLQTVGKLGVVTVYRILIPATDATTAAATIDGAMHVGGWKALSKGRYKRSDSIAVVTPGTDVVAIDISLGRNPDEGFKQLAAALAQGHATAPTLSSVSVHITYAPECVGESGFLSGLHSTLGALGGGSIEPDLKERIAREGLWESARNLVLARNERGARFARVDLAGSLDAGHSTLTMRAEPGPGFDIPPDDTWVPTFTAVSAAGAVVRSFDASRPFVSAWKLPGGPGHTALDGTDLLHAIRDAGWTGWIVALPDEIASGAWMSVHSKMAMPQDVLDRLARFALTEVTAAAASPGSTVEPSSVFVGVLPEGTNLATAECVLAGPPPCGAKKLTLGVARRELDGHARLVQVEKHYVVLYSTDPKALFLKMKGESAGPIRLVVDPHQIELFSVLDASLGASLVGTMRRDGKDVVFELTGQ
jgi:hypothetical protein